MNKTAVVLGATGLVGRALVDQLADAGHIGKVVTLTRRSASHSSSKVFNQIVNFDHLEEWAPLFRADFLFSCLGTTLKQAGSIAARHTVDHDYQLKAAQLASDNDVRHYLLVSSSAADAQSNNSYLKMKGELEQRIKVLPFERISIFQPSLLKGERTDFRLGEKLGGWVLPLLGFIPWLRRFRPITGEQVAAKMVQVSLQSGQALEWFRLDEIL